MPLPYLIAHNPKILSTRASSDLQENIHIHHLKGKVASTSVTWRHSSPGSFEPASPASSIPHHAVPARPEKCFSYLLLTPKGST